MTWIFGMPIAATRTVSQRTSLVYWYWWYCDGWKALKTCSGWHDNRPKLTVKTTV